jgi:uncharacterized repeat protein (TIGR03803 family)
MKTRIKNLFALPVLIAGLGLWLTEQATAQTLTVLHSFTNNPEGSAPAAGLTLSGNTLYGTTAGGGHGFGTIFAVNSNGTGFTNLYSFTGGNDGATPRAGLLLSSSTLYGTVQSGGTNGAGGIFSINTNGADFTNLYSFTAVPGSFPRINNDGGNPQAALILSGSTLYGTALNGGTNGFGTVFAINMNGTGFTNLYNFTAGEGTVPHDGAGPAGTLVLSGNTLFGTTEGGGFGAGTVFSVQTNGAGIDPIHPFTSPPTDGQVPLAGVVLSGNMLYGTTSEGGTFSEGMVFGINTSGSGFTNLYSFSAVDPNTGTNRDGAEPIAGLLLSGGMLYGTTDFSGFFRFGTIFAVSTNGIGFTNLYNFTGGSDGSSPTAGLILSGTTLYGTTSGGGSSGHGTVFSLSLVASAPKLNLNLLGTNVLLTWSATGYTLQATTNLNTPAWITVPGQNMVTNSISGTQKFYRLSQ